MSGFETKGYCSKCKTIVAMDDGPTCNCAEELPVCSLCEQEIEDGDVFTDDENGEIYCIDCWLEIEPYNEDEGDR